MEGNSFQCGDAVRVSDDMTLVHQLQDGHGEWADDIALVYIYLLSMYKRRLCSMIKWNSEHSENLY